MKGTPMTDQPDPLWPVAYDLDAVLGRIEVTLARIEGQLDSLLKLMGDR